jgi:excinuclease ABC subunit C
VAVEVLKEAGLAELDVAALAKARTGGGRRLKRERVYLPGRRASVVVPESSSGLRLIAHVRDEAHRFAVAYHRLLRRKALLASPLTTIRGVGPKTARRLLEALGGLEQVKDAGLDELKAVQGVSTRAAEAVHAYYHRPPGGSEDVEGG